MIRHRIAHRRLGAQERNHRHDVGIAQLVILHERNRGAAVSSHAVAQQPRDVAIAPAPNSGRAVGRQIRHADRSKRNRELHSPAQARRAACPQGRVVGGGGVTIRAVRRAIGQITAAGQDGGIARRRQRRIGRLEAPVPAHADRNDENRDNEQDGRTESEQYLPNHRIPPPGGRLSISRIPRRLHGA